MIALALGGNHAAYAYGTFTMRVPTTDGTSTSVWVDTSTILGEWVDVEGKRSCAAWTPATSKVLLDEEFIQTRDCEQLQEQEVIAEQVDSVSGETRSTTYTNERYITETETQDAVGTMEAWVFTTSTFTDWEYTGETSYSDWTPASSSQTEDYTQTRNVYTYKERYEQLRQVYNSTGEIREVGIPQLRSGYDTEEESRYVSVSYGDWEYPGTYYSCDNWSTIESDDTSDTYYQQKGTCLWLNTRLWTHTVDGSTVYTYTESRTPSGTVYRYVQTYSCKNTDESDYGYVEPWSGCTAR